MIKKQFTLYLENRPGELARVTRALAEAEINIEAISAYTSSDVALAQIVASNASRTRAALSQAGVSFTEQDVVLVDLPDEPGALANVAARIADSGANINYVYATTSSARGRSYVVISAPNPGRVAKRLG